MRGEGGLVLRRVAQQAEGFVRVLKEHLQQAQAADLHAVLPPLLQERGLVQAAGKGRVQRGTDAASASRTPVSDRGLSR